MVIYLIRITMVGTGYVGLVIAVVLAQIGHDVICVGVALLSTGFFIN